MMINHGLLFISSRYTKDRNKDTTERKEVVQYSNLDEDSETPKAGVSDYTQSSPHVPKIAKEDEGYESIEFVERLQGHDNNNKMLSNECKNVLSPPLIDLAPSRIHRIHGTKHDKQNIFGETAGSDKEEHINIFGDAYDESNSTDCTDIHMSEDPCYLHPVSRDNDIHNKPRATVNEVKGQTAQFITERSFAATPVCIAQNEADDSGNLSALDDGDNVRLTGTVEVDSCIQTTACNPADSGYVKPVTCP